MSYLDMQDSELIIELIKFEEQCEDTQVRQLVMAARKRVEQLQPEWSYKVDAGVQYQRIVNDGLQSFFFYGVFQASWDENVPMSVITEQLITYAWEAGGDARAEEIKALLGIG